VIERSIAAESARSWGGARCAPGAPVVCFAALVALTSLVACGDDGGGLDAGVDGGLDASEGLDASDPADAHVDAGPRGPLVGPTLVFQGDDACYRTDLPADAYTFLWGDGSREETTSPSACHVFPYAGAFVVSVIAGPRDASLTVQVVLRPAVRPPSASSTMAAYGDRLFVASADDDSVAVVDRATLTREARLSTCDRPRTLAVSGDELAVSCQDGHALARFDARTLSRLPDVALGVGVRPFGVAADPRFAGRFVVALQDAGALVVVEDGAVVARLEGLVDARAVAVNDRGVALVTRWRRPPEGAQVYQVDLDDPRAPRLSSTVLLPRQTGLDSDTDNSGAPSFLDALAFSPDGVRAMIPALKANDVTGLHRTGAALQSQTTVRGVFSELYPDDEGTYEETYRFSFNDLDYVSAVTTTPIGDRVFVAFLGGEQILALEPFGLGVQGGITNVGHAPRGLFADDDGRLFVHAELSREVRVYDVRELGAPPLLATIRVLDDEPLASDVLRGEVIFTRAVDPRMSRTSYVSCASCHLDGESDGLVWDFTQRGEGLRNTTSLVGLGDQRGPLHWTGNFDEVQDFENDIRLHQGGAGFLSDDDWSTREDPLGLPKAGRSEALDALAAYLASLRGVGASPTRLTDDERTEGARAFVSAGCVGCHSGAAFSDSASGVRHDVGTAREGSGARLGAPLDGFDTPTLRGLWRTAPYLHDGSASTLREAIERHAATAFGALDDAAQEALVRHVGALE
jgi:YVTN family beta-propeller protein